MFLTPPVYPPDGEGAPELRGHVPGEHCAQLHRQHRRRAGSHRDLRAGGQDQRYRLRPRGQVCFLIFMFTGFTH